MDESPEKVRKLGLSCIICGKSLDEGRKAVCNPTAPGIQTLINAAEKRKDDVLERLQPYIQNPEGSFKVAFHINCRATYTSKRNLGFIYGSSSKRADLTDPGEGSSKRPRRSETSEFDIRRDCFICGKEHRRQDKLTQVSTGTGASTRQRTLDAAECRQDHTVRLRMLAYPDLFAADAKYHRKCYGHFISERNIAAAAGKGSEKLTAHQIAFSQLYKDIDSTLLSKKKPIVLLSDLQGKFVGFLREGGIDDEQGYTSWRLKEKLKKYYGSKIVFISQKGKSDLVCSSSVSFLDAIEHGKDQTDVGEFQFGVAQVDQGDTCSTLHRAAGIIQNAVKGITFNSDQYSPSGDLDIKKCKAFVPNILIDFVYWCTNKNDLDNATTASEKDENDPCLLKVLAICHNIIALSCTTQTPITFGLGVRMHHDFGCKSLIEDCNAVGYSISYDEVRRFLTSVAKDEIDKSESGVYIPSGLSVFDSQDPCSIVHSAIDNFDQNEDTLDGKSSTHCMAVVLYQTNSSKTEISGIPRQSSKSFDAAQYEEPQIQMYRKPNKRPEPPVASSVSVLEVKRGGNYESSQVTDLVWMLARKIQAHGSSVPAWGGFNSIVADISVPITTIRYLPFIQASPSDFSTIYTTLLKLVAISTNLGQDHICVTADLAIYSKAQQILWTGPPSLIGRVTMRLGAMHLIMAFIAAIGKLFSDGGLMDILTSSGVFAVSSAVQMLQGKHYARAVRGLKIAYEAMMHCLLSAAETYASDNDLPWVDDKTFSLIADLEASFQVGDSALVKVKCIEIAKRMSTVSDTLAKFKKEGRHQSSTFAYWDSFLETVSVLLRLLRADREGDFLLHLDAVLETVPYFHLAGRINYARYAPVYVLDMKMLEHNHPISYHHLLSGGFVVRRKDDISFNCIPTDQALEQTINREAKSDGGVIGFTLRKSALLRWLLTRHVTGEYCETFKELCSTKQSRKEHSELGKARILRDTEDVSRVYEYIQNHCQNPFNLKEVAEGLVNIVSGRIASKPVEESLRNLPEKGKVACEQFIKERLVEQNKSFWDAIPKKPALTFADMKKHMTNDKEKKITIDTEVLFRRLLCVSKNRDVDLKMVLSYELAAVPPSLFHDDGAMRKTDKSELAKKLESVSDEIVELPVFLGSGESTAAYIIDGMALIQTLNEDFFKTFNDLAEVIAKKLIRLLKNPVYQAGEVIIVFDRYDCPSSIKLDERERRGAAVSASQTHLIVSNRTVPSFRQFLKGAGNKPALVEFISSYLMGIMERIPTNKSVVIAGGFRDGEKVVRVSCQGTKELVEQFSDQEEADTRMVLHAVGVKSQYLRTIIRCDDTDVLVILIYYMSLGLLTDEVFMHAGHAGKYVTRERFIPVHSLASELGKAACLSLPFVHALTGCDSTNSIFGIGKKTACTVLLKMPESVCSKLYKSPAESWLAAATEFVLLMYGKKAGKCKTLNELRYKLATTTDIQATHLPPTDDAFKQHASRARYQSLIWCSSHLPKPQLGEPEDCGWYRDSSGLHPVLFTQDSAPAEVRDLTHLYCQCKESNCKDGSRCTCVHAGLKCIELCICEDCPNVQSGVVSSAED